MAAVDLFKGYHATVCTDSLGGTTIGTVLNFDIGIANNLEASYALGARTPNTLMEGNQLVSGNLTLALRDKTQVLDLATASPIADDTIYVRASTGVGGTETVDLTLNNLKWGDWSTSFANDGSTVQENCTWMAKTITVAETSN